MKDMSEGCPTLVSVSVFTCHTLFTNEASVDWVVAL